MAEVTVKGSHLIPAVNALATLVAWLRPGYLAFIVGEHLEGLRPHATRVYAERERMLDEAALLEPETIQGGGPDDGKPNPKAGQRVVVTRADGTTLTPFRTKEAGVEFARREAELYDVAITVHVGERLTRAHMRMIDAERLPAPRSINGAPPPAEGIDFAGLLVLVDEAQPPAQPGQPAAPPAALARA